jgi:hypothetical protein
MVEKNSFYIILGLQIVEKIGQPLGGFSTLAPIVQRFEIEWE